MKLKSKLKPLAVAITLAFVQQGAHAAPVAFDATTGNSSFLFFAFDATPGVEKSFIQGLNTRLDNIVAAPNAQQTFNLAGLSNLFAGSLNAVWGVVAADAVGSGFSNFRVVTSANTANGAPLPNATALRSATTAFQNFVFAAGNGNPIATTVTSDPAYAGQPLWSANWGGQLPNAVNSLTNGSVLSAWLIDAGTINNANRTPVTIALNKWQLNLNGANGAQLVYAPVPVPAALWLLGSSMMGLISVARRRNV